MSFWRSVSCGVPVALLSILRSEANDDLVQARDRPFYGDRMPYHQPFGTKCASNSAESISHHLTLNSLTRFLIILEYETYRLCCHMLPLNCIEDFIELVRRGWTWFSYQLPAVHAPSKPFHIFSLGVQLSRFPKALVHILCWSMLIYILLGGGCHFFPSLRTWWFLTVCGVFLPHFDASAKVSIGTTSTFHISEMDMGPILPKPVPQDSGACGATSYSDTRSEDVRVIPAMPRDATETAAPVARDQSESHGAIDNQPV